MALTDKSLRVRRDEGLQVEVYEGLLTSDARPEQIYTLTDAGWLDQDGDRVEASLVLELDDLVTPDGPPVPEGLDPTPAPVVFRPRPFDAPPVPDVDEPGQDVPRPVVVTPPSPPPPPVVEDAVTRAERERNPAPTPPVRGPLSQGATPVSENTGATPISENDHGHVHDGTDDHSH